jgi:hypothetical protein
MIHLTDIAKKMFQKKEKWYVIKNDIDEIDTLKLYDELENVDVASTLFLKKYAKK